MPPFESDECFKEAKTVKTGTKFIIRDITQCMGEHIVKLVIQLRSRVELHTHREMWVS